jgi:acyl carrier protein
LWIEERKVASIFLFPSMVRAMLADDPPRSTFASLQSLWLSGEPVTRADEELMARFLPPSTMVTSIYSSTETGLVATSTASLAERRTRTSPPPFVPAPDRQVDILDELGVHVAVGDVGELVVRSPVMGRGYLPEDPRRTGTFEPHDDGTTTIRTCDAGRREEGGTFSLAGRLDRMVKIRGYRVELGEVEAVLGEVPGIADRTVIAIPGRRGDTRLFAFVEAAAGVALDESSVRRRLLERLPRHFVPDRVIELDRLPRLQSGKVARHQLPPVTRTMATGLEPPRSDIEAHIAAIVRRTLDLDVVGVEADLFFDLGADSLDVQEIFVAMSDDIGIDLPLSLAAEARTIRDLGALAAASSLVERPIVVRPGAPTATPLVMVHGAYGSVLFASTIAAGLPHNVGVHGLALPHAIATGVEAPPRTLAELAQRHLSTLRSVQPRGPYRVGGFSAGGAIALEMAAILEEEGEQVELVVMLDTPRQGSAIGAADGAVLSRGVENRLLLGRLREGGLRGVPRVLAVQRVREAGRRAARRELRRFHRDGGTVAPFARHAYLGALMHRLVREHVPTRPVTTPVLYVSAQATSYGPPGADAARGPLEVVEFPTDHEHLVDTTWGPQVGAVIGQHLHSDDV